MDLSKKVFGANVKKEIRDYIYELQQSDFEIKPGESVDPKTESYLGDKTPYVRMWTAVSFGKVKSVQNDKGKWEWKDAETKTQRVYSINENRHEYYSELGSINLGINPNYVYQPELEKNQYLKPQAGIKSVNSKSEGAVGALRRTTVEFVVHNKNDFETIYLPFFLKPGATVFVDFGWSDELLNLYTPEVKLEA